jgi:tetratricopeptide (TPR) repeat protein
VLRKIAARPDSDGRADLVAGLTLRNLDDPAWIDCLKRALERADPEGVVERRTLMRVVSEVARAADLAGRRDLLDAAAHRFIALARRRPGRDPILEDETLNPVAMAAGRKLADGEIVEAAALLRGAGGAVLDHLPGTLQKLKQRGDVETLAKAGLEQGATPAELGEFLLRVFGRVEAALRVLELGVPAGDAAFRLRVAGLRAKAGQRARALELARQGLEGEAEPAVRVSLALLAARILLDQGDARGALDLARPIADGNPDRAAHVAELLDAAGDDDRALAMYRRAESQGWRPYSNLARLYHRAGRHEEALDFYERDLKSGSMLPVWPENENLGPLPIRSGAAATSAEGRHQVLKILGRE